MPLYGTAQAGSNPTAGLNLTSLEPGDSITLISTADAVAGTFKSVAINRGNKETGDAPITFFLSGCGASSVCKIEIADVDLDARYIAVGTITGNGIYTESTGAPFLRADITTYNSPDVPVVTATRL